MATSKNTIGATIKKELTAAFKGIKFSVRYESFSGGDAVRISWTNGPTSKEVEEITNKYKAGQFDGMTDMYNYNKSSEVEQTAKYITTSREVTEDLKLAVAAAYCEKCGVEMEKQWYNTNVNGQWLSAHVTRILSKTSFKTSTPEFKSLEFVDFEFVVIYTEVVNGEIVKPKIRFRLRPAMPTMQIVK